MNDFEVSVGFGTAGLQGACFQAVTSALKAGFRKFDTAEASVWYDQPSVGKALAAYFESEIEDCQPIIKDDEGFCADKCLSEDLRVSTKIPPWELTSFENILENAQESRDVLVGFCDESTMSGRQFPLDVYYIHAPECWKGWHPQCDEDRLTIPLDEAWLGMEAVVDQKISERIGLSNVWPSQLLEIINFVKERGNNYDGQGAPPRLPDVIQAYADPLQPAKELRRMCEEYGIEFVSYSTLGTQHAMKNGYNPVLNNKEIKTIAKKHRRTSAEVVLSWALQSGMSVIPRSRQEPHILELSNMFTRPIP